MKCIFLHFLLLLSLISYGQENKSINNLSERDSLQYLALKQQFAKHINPNPDSSLFYTSKIKEFSLKKKYKVGIVEAPYFKAFYFRRIQKLDSAVYYFDLASALAKEHDYLRGLALAQNGLCRIYYFLGQTENALNACKQCLEAATEMNDLPIITDTYTALGNTYSRQNNMTMAISYYLKADSIHTKTPQRPDIIAATYQSLGTIYEDLKDYDKSIEYFLKSNAEFEKIPADVTFYLNSTNLHLGSVYYHKGDLEIADSLLQKTYTYFKEIKEEGSVATISTYIGLIRLKQDNIVDAERFLLEGFQLNKDKKYSYETANAVLELGKLYVKKNEPRKAVYYFNELLVKYNEDDNALLQQETLQSLAEAYALSKDYGKAYEALQQTNYLKDSINTAQGLGKIREIEAIYQTEKKEQEITLLKSQNELVEQQKKNQRNQLLGGIGLSSLAGLFFFFLYRNRQKTTIKLKELDKVKSNFFTNISHEFRTPLTLISGPIQHHLKQPDLKKEERSNFEMAERNSQRLLSLVDQLLALSKIEAGNLKLNIQQGALMPFIGTLTDSFTYTAEKKEINYIVNNKPTQEATWFDKDALEKMVVNLLSNAIKYTPNKGSVVSNAFIKSNHLHFEVKNTGKGLSKAAMTHIFDRFYQQDDHQQGVGIGLALVKELARLHKGSIEVDSILDEWTTFSLILPINRERFDAQEIAVTGAVESVQNSNTIFDNPEMLFSEKGEDQSQVNSEAPILLIVDDNADIRSYVSNLFNSHYRILKAKNGEEGIDIAIQEVPDIILSDIMMPVKNGIELCNTLKVDERTSHIPIILLTAKVGEENEIEGIQTGADDYVTKPFNEELLEVRVKKLIENRRKLQERYSQEVILRPKDIAITSVDEQFLERIQKVLDKQLIEPAFSIEEFSKAAGMSRMQLHRKLKALTGLSASEFIRSQRLKLAAQLLEKSDINVSQVGYSVGFNDHAYFSKCFKEMYHSTPSAYAKSVKK